MSGMTTAFQEAASNPLDVMEQIVIANDWVFDRRNDSEDHCLCECLCSEQQGEEVGEVRIGLR